MSDDKKEEDGQLFIEGSVAVNEDLWAKLARRPAMTDAELDDAIKRRLGMRLREHFSALVGTPFDKNARARVEEIVLAVLRDEELGLSEAEARELARELGYQPNPGGAT